jgi:hypothetical protein
MILNASNIVSFKKFKLKDLIRLPMKKRINYLQLICGLFLFIPFNFLKFCSDLNISEEQLHLLGIAAMVGIILILISLIKISLMVEIRLTDKKKPE